MYKYLILLLFFSFTETQAGDNLGRLFLTPEQRAQLDLVRVKRDQRQPLTAEPEPAIAAAPAPQGPSAVTYSGVLRRSDGKSTVWINGKPVDERSHLNTVRGVNVLGMRSDGTVSLAIPQSARTVSMKVGQQLEVHSGRVEEAYARRGTNAHLGENALNAPVAGGMPVVDMRRPVALSSQKKPVMAARESYDKNRDPKSETDTHQPSDKN